jgi:hypothetical protein
MNEVFFIIASWEPAPNGVPFSDIHRLSLLVVISLPSLLYHVGPFKGHSCTRCFALSITGVPKSMVNLLHKTRNYLSMMSKAKEADEPYSRA